MTGDAILYLLPELLLIAVATGIYVLGAFAASRTAWSCAAVGGIVAAGAALAMQNHSPALSGGPLTADALALYGRWLALAVGLLFALLSSRVDADVPRPEFAGTLLMVVAGTMLVAAAGDLVLMFLGLELISIPTYLLLYIARRSPDSQEAAAKYFFLSVLSSAVLLYGLSFLYGVGGSTDLGEVRAAFAARAAAGGLGPLAALALVLVFAGLGFRVAAAPFHFYAPDVYQGTTNGNAGLLSVVPKVAGFVALVRLTMLAMPGMEELGWRMALILAMLTMTVGNVLALWQDNVRRLMAYSSIAHAGYMLIGLAVGFAAAGDAGRPAAVDGVGALLFYLSVYAVATTGTFAALAWLGRDGEQIDTVDQLAGLGRARPIAGLAIAAFMFSLAGVPPLAGFWGKLQLFLSALSVDSGGASVTPVQGWFLALAVVGVANAAIAAAYYLRIVGVMYFRSAETDALSPAEGGAGAFAAMLLCAVLTLVLGVLPGPLLQQATLAGGVVKTLAAESVSATAELGEVRAAAELIDR